MNAQETLLEYARKHNNEKVYTHQQWLGKMFVEAVVIDRQGGTVVIANGRREGKTIIVDETTREPVLEGYKETTKEVMRLEL